MPDEEERRDRRELMLDREAGKLAGLVVDRELSMQAAVVILESEHEERTVGDRARLAAHVLRRGLQDPPVT